MVYKEKFKLGDFVVAKSEPSRIMIVGNYYDCCMLYCHWVEKNGLMKWNKYYENHLELTKADKNSIFNILNKVLEL